MDLKEFLDSGLSELYLLGVLTHEEAALVQKMQVLHSEVKREIEALELFYEQDAIQNAVKLHPRVDKQMNVMLSALQTEKQMQLSETPLISIFSDADAWLELVTPLLPNDNFGDGFTSVLRNNNGVMQMLAISSIDIEEEVHEDVDESFLILKGTCICTIGNESINMGPGDFMQIPLYKPHSVSITSTSLIAILQHVECVL